MRYFSMHYGRLIAPALPLAVVGLCLLPTTAVRAQVVSQRTLPLSGELMLEGTVVRVDLSKQVLVLLTTQFTLPSAKSSRIAPPKEKIVTVSQATFIHGLGQKSRFTLEQIGAGQAGEPIQVTVLGRDAGSGKPLNARELVVTGLKAINSEPAPKVGAESKAASGPTLEETVAWLTEKIDGYCSGRTTLTGLEREYDYQVLKFEKGSLHVRRSVKMKDWGLPGLPYRKWREEEIEIPLSQCDPQQIFIERGWVVVNSTKDKKAFPVTYKQYKANGNIEEQGSFNSEKVEFYPFSTPELTDRVVKALHHAITLSSGGKTNEPF